MSERRTCATSICQRICKAHVFDETFRVNSAFNAEVFVAPPHAVAMEFDLFGKRRSDHLVKGGGAGKRQTSGWLDRDLPDRRQLLLYNAARLCPKSGFYQSAKRTSDNSPAV